MFFFIIFRGLYHEFELLTTVVPPPKAFLESNCKKISTANEAFNKLNCSMMLHGSSTTLSSNSLVSSAKNNLEKRKLKKKFKRYNSNINSKNVENQKNKSKMDKNLQATSKSKKYALVANNDAIEIEKENLKKSTESKEFDGENTDSEDISSLDIFDQTGQQKKGQKSQLSEMCDEKISLSVQLNHHEKKLFSMIKSRDIIYSVDEALSTKRNLNLFQNLRQNVRNRLNKFPFQLGNNSNSGELPLERVNKMKSAMKTFMAKPLRFKIKTNQKAGNFQSMGRKFGRKKKDLNQSINVANIALPVLTPGDDDRNMSGNGTIDGIPPKNNEAVLDGNSDDDDSIFILPHQHYYWNPYYQLLNKSQKQKLLGELDAVMHLLFANVGVEFIWTKLADTFQLATADAVALKNICNTIIKSIKSNKQNRVPCADDIPENTGIGSKNTSEDDDESDEDSVEVDDEDEDNYDEEEDDEELFSGIDIEDVDVDEIGDGEDEDDDEEEEDNDEDEQYSESETWFRSLASLINENSANYFSSSTASSLSSTPYLSPRICSPECEVDTSHSMKEIVLSELKNKLHLSYLLPDRCRQCGQTIAYNSPVQPVGTESITILEACTLVRFLLGDSQPYFHQRNDTKKTKNFGLMSSSCISMSMNRCSALEPSSVETINYSYLVQFLVNVLQLMGQNARLFNTVDLRASIELCLALCAKLKPAIMQTFVLRYRNEIDKKNKFDQNSKQAISTSHLRRTSLTNWLNQQQSSSTQVTGQPNRKTRSLSSGSNVSLKSASTKQLELVKEEENENEDFINTEPLLEETMDDFEEDKQEDDKLNDDFQIESIIDAVLNFFSTFVESIMVKQSRISGQKLSTGKVLIFKFYNEIIANGSTDINQFKSMMTNSDWKFSAMKIRHKLLPIYQLLCELLIEIGTMPMLSSPAFLLKKRDENLGKNQHNDDTRWFIYLLSLSSIGLSSCSNQHSLNNSVGTSLKCCQMRHIAYTSLATILDLMTVTRAYIISQPTHLPLANSETEFALPSYVNMLSVDLFPNTFVARRLNFFPLVQPNMLQNVYGSTCWFKIIASGLWSNLSNLDSVLHFATAALLQQLHSISFDESLCEYVICDAIIGDFYGELPSSRNNGRKTSANLNQNNFHLVHKARSKFILLFSIIADIRFISERLALIVNGLSATVKSFDKDKEIDFYLPLTEQQNDSKKLISLLESELASGLFDMHKLMDLTLKISYKELHQLLRITCPVSPLALCSYLKRHFDRPLFIMLDALSQRRTLCDQYSISADWLLHCINVSDPFGAKNLMFTSPNGTGITTQFQNYYDVNHHSTSININNIGRILEPLLFILLHPNTARLSVKNVNILRYTKNYSADKYDKIETKLSPKLNELINLNKDTLDHQHMSLADDESKIYAISSTNGMLI